MSKMDGLADYHFTMLREGSGISEEVIRARGYRTITDPRELGALNFTPVQQRTPGLLLPGHAPDGSNGFCTFRPDSPRQARGRNGKLTDRIVKYEIPKSTGMRLDCPPLCRSQILDPAIPLWITEGQKKADALVTHGLCAIALLGVWNFKGKNLFKGITLLADFDYIALNGRDVRIVFDCDLMFKSHVRQALERLTEHLQRKGAYVSVIYLPGGRESKVGVDDFLLTHTIDDLESLIDAPRPQPKAAKPVIELLDTAPLVMRRPLALIDGRAYAAIWPYVRVTTTEGVNKSGEIIRHEPPIECDEQRLMIVRDDGTIFDDINTTFKDLNFKASLEEIPPVDKLWSTPGVKRYRLHERPGPADVFWRICDVVDLFIDFDKSLASQREMCEFIACYIISSWFLDAFNVAGYVWPNGERGSGKTQLLTLLAALGYLGQTLLAGSSYASLRDLADYGAMLCFDDAENLSDPKGIDADKRTLLLAGNRRGSTITVKELVDQKYRTRHVSTYCPRAFSAIRLPDAVLASRTIIVPLIRTPDRERANADPLDDKLWPHDRRQLIDDLWALSLANLARLPQYDRRVGQEASLIGRNLEPWRAVLAIAAWLDENDVKGLWKKMDGLSRKYQAEKQEFESGDITSLVIRALCKCFGTEVSAISAISAISLEEDSKFVTTKEVAEAVREIAVELDADIDVDRISEKRVGRVLSKLRLNRLRPRGSKGRGWYITTADLYRRVVSVGFIQDADSSK
jgi:hypothetical protein